MGPARVDLGKLRVAMRADGHEVLTPHDRARRGCLSTHRYLLVYRLSISSSHRPARLGRAIRPRRALSNPLATSHAERADGVVEVGYVRIEYASRHRRHDLVAVGTSVLGGSVVVGVGELQAVSVAASTPKVTMASRNAKGVGLAWPRRDDGSNGSRGPRLPAHPLPQHLHWIRTGHVRGVAGARNCSCSPTRFRGPGGNPDRLVLGVVHPDRLSGSAAVRPVEEPGRSCRHRSEPKREAQTWLKVQTADNVLGEWLDPRGRDITLCRWTEQWLAGRRVRETRTIRAPSGVRAFPKKTETPA